MDKIKKIAKKFKLIIVEDAAEALGSYYKKNILEPLVMWGVLVLMATK